MSHNHHHQQQQPPPPPPTSNPRPPPPPPPDPPTPLNLLLRRFRSRNRAAVPIFAGVVLSGLFFIYARTSVQAAKANAQRHREADSVSGDGVNLLRESRRRHGLEPRPVVSSSSNKKKDGEARGSSSDGDEGTGLVGRVKGKFFGSTSSGGEDRRDNKVEDYSAERRRRGEEEERLRALRDATRKGSAAREG